MNRVVLMAAVASAASALLAFAPAGSLRVVRGGASAASPSSRPSVVLLLVDGAPASMLAGPRRVPTPHLDRLAERGRRFEAAYTQYPLSAASRMSVSSDNGIVSCRQRSTKPIDGEKIGHQLSPRRVSVFTATCALCTTRIVRSAPVAKTCASICSCC